MIAIDSSAIVSIVRREPDAAVLVDVIDQAPRAFMSVVSYVETNMVVAGRRADADLEVVDETLKALHVSIAPVSVVEGGLALTAFLQFGKGRHPAALNIGDCFAYALAKSRGLPLLFKGDDFRRTDIVAAWQP